MLLKLFKIIFPLIAIIFIAKLIYDYWPKVVATDWNINIALLAISWLTLVLIFFLDAIGWWLILRASGEKISAVVAISIWIRSSLSRYIPGVIWAYASRVVLIKEYGVSSTNCIKSLIMESIMLALGAFTVGLPAILSQLPLDFHGKLLLGSLCVLAILWGLSERGLSFVGRLPFIGRYLGESFFPQSKRRWQVYLFYSFFWACFSIVFVVFLWSINIHFDSLEDTLLAGCMFSASFCIGFILIVFPGGLGIREVTLYGLLSSLISPTAAIAISVGSRLWLILGEIASIAIYLTAAYFHESQQ